MYIRREDWHACVLTRSSSFRTNCLMFLYTVVSSFCGENIPNQIDSRKSCTKYINTVADLNVTTSYEKKIVLYENSKNNYVYK